jgi:amino acid permease
MCECVFRLLLLYLFARLFIYFLIYFGDRQLKTKKK